MVITSQQKEASIRGDGGICQPCVSFSTALQKAQDIGIPVFPITGFCVLSEKAQLLTMPGSFMARVLHESETVQVWLGRTDF